MIGRIHALRTGLALLALLLLLSSCGGPELIGLAPAYIGAPVLDTRHEFEVTDFILIASYDDGTDRELLPGEYKMEQVGLERGYYLIRFTYRGEEQMCYVECDVPVYPSERKS